MTAHVHDPATHGGPTRPEPAATDAAPMRAARPRWLLPGLLVAIVAGGLVLAGVLSPSAVLYAGLFGGMFLMHVGGHGGHGGGGHGGHGHGAPSAPNDLSRRSSGSQPAESGFGAGLDERGTNDSTTSETNDHDQHSSHGCH